MRASRDKNLRKNSRNDKEYDKLKTEIGLFNPESNRSRHELLTGFYQNE